MANKQAIAVFLLAMIVRGFIFGQTLDHPEVVFQPDSRMYVSLAQGLQDYGTFSFVEKPDTPHVERMPGYPFFVASILSIFGENFLYVIIIQIIIDSLSCVLIYYLGESVRQGIGLVSGIFAGINMNMITYSNFILTDSVFLFFFLITLMFAYKFFKEPMWKNSIFLGAIIGITAMIRPVILYFPVFILPLFFIYHVYKLGIPALTATGRILSVVLVFVFIISPWLVRNFSHYGRFRLGAQGGEHLLPYVVPFVWQYSKGIPFIEGMKQANEKFHEECEREHIDIEKANPFEVNDFKVGMAIDILKNEPKSAIIKAWVFGIVKNLFAPAIIDFSYLLNIERPHFFYTEGKTLIERGWKFIRGIKGFFGWVVIVSIFELIASRLLQLWGLILLFRKKKWEALFCILIIGYFLLVSGPVGYAKYRLPFEPILIILLAISLRDIYERVMRYKLGEPPSPFGYVAPRRKEVGKNTKGDSGNKGKQWDADLRRWTQIRVIVF